ncbi:type II toxin-antitoxin system Phd/YefM family antitoxin [Streptomyces sp. V3I7]|uniref:type II toxin-antitoxin system Phd/YefM family antitoxin n=1 Tax=Streptomyces sp. V3I7 TaxID=3042278 RepID=UPI002784C6C0|nr:type II toxin-antitoxin system prevent-host-death family antitoxin [Streptomyces sp. V3I7]MDQ0993154.1 prevent-host-death family protein [Streptomyces sp. V3I7]
MEITAREFNQNASKILAAAERGELITVIKNGRPVATLSPAGSKTVAPYPTDPMGEDESAPILRSSNRRGVRPVDWQAGRGSYLEGFGA